MVKKPHVEEKAKSKKTKDPVTEAFLKSKAAASVIEDVVDTIKERGGSPSETTSEKVYTKAIKEVMIDAKGNLVEVKTSPTLVEINKKGVLGKVKKRPKGRGFGPGAKKNG